MHALFLATYLVVTIQADPASPMSFKSHVAPILVRKCLGCHNHQKAESGLNMKTYALLRKGGKTLAEAIIEPGDPSTSHLIEVLRSDASPRMPFKQPPLSGAEVSTLETWIQQGARFDGESESETKLSSLVNPLEDLPKVAPFDITSDPISALAFSPDGTRVAVAIGKEVRLIELGSKVVVTRFAEHPGQVSALKFTPDGRELIACGGRPGMFGFVVAWNLESNSKRLDLRGHSDAILCADLAIDGCTLATSSYDRMIKIWDITTGQELRTLKEHTDAVYGVSFSPDGALVASAGGDRTVKVWETSTGKRLVSLSDATAEQYCVAFGLDGKSLFAAGVDRTIRIWRLDGANATLERSAFAHDAPVLRLAIAPDGRSLVSASEDRMLKLWDLQTLAPKSSLGAQLDWPLSLSYSPDGLLLAVGRYDGSAALIDAESGATKATLIAPLSPGSEPALDPNVKRTEHETRETQKLELARNATLNPPSPRGATRGSTVKVALSGNGIGSAEAISFLDPGIQVTILPREKPDANAIDAEFKIAADAREGIYRFLVRTPRGTPQAQNFAVTAYGEANEVEPNDDPTKLAFTALPACLVGAIEKPGDVDQFLIEAKANRTLVFELLARPLGSGLNPELALLNAQGRPVATATRGDDGREPQLVFTPEQDEPLTFRVRDTDLGGSSGHFYRVSAGENPRVASVFPLAVSAGQSISGRLDGVNIKSYETTLKADSNAKPGAILALTKADPASSDTECDLKYVVATGLQSIEAEANDRSEVANALVVPGGVSGRIDPAGDEDLFKFDARKGDRLVLEVFGRRLGSPIDSSIEIVDAAGNPIPRALVRPMRETLVAFRDHPSTGRNIRLTHPWTGFSQGDIVLIGRELSRIAELPRNPDDDAVFWGLGNPRNNTGDRIALLETTPEHHPQGQPIYQVELHPPGAVFPPGGVPPRMLYYRNDDGGPGIGKDSKLTFDVPDDGSYFVRVQDVRGLGGPRFGYHMVIREPHPDFELNLATTNINIPRGSAVVVPVNLTRIDGFMEPVDVSIENLPQGISATPATIEAEQFTADVLFMAELDSPAYPHSDWRVVASRATDQRQSTKSIEAKPGWITVTPEPNLNVSFQPDRVEIRPGEEATLTLKVERRNGFKGRVPIEVRNLPFGVRVLHIGLNGVLVTDQQSERVVTLYAEPWVTPQERPFYAVGQCEEAGTFDSSRPIVLAVRPSSGSVTQAQKP